MLLDGDNLYETEAGPPRIQRVLSQRQPRRSGAFPVRTGSFGSK